MKKKYFRFLSLAFFLIGIFFLLNSKTDITGAVVGVSNISSGLSSIFGIVFILVSAMLFVGGENLEALVEEKPLPGKGIKGDYVPLNKILNEVDINSNKVHVNLKDNKIYRDGREVQGLKLRDNYIEFKGVHFTNSGAAKIIEDHESLEIKNLEDPYVYLSESLDYSGKSEKKIRHMLGSSSAEEAVIVSVQYPIDKIYLKFEKGRPTHYAINGDIKRENLLVKRGYRVLRKKIEEL